MARAKWTTEDLPDLAKLGAIFVAFGAVMGLLRGDGIVIGAVAGVLLFGLVIGVGVLVGLIGRGGE